MEIVLSRSADEFVPKDRWVASLSNGETIYEDNRKDISPSWERLASYCEVNTLSITNLRLQIASTEVKLPSGQQGYLQKKIAWLVGSEGGITKCIGYVQDGLSLIYEVDPSRGSRSIRTNDPGFPWVIYREDIRKAKVENASSIT